MRLFLALNLPGDVRSAMHDATAPLRDAAPREVGWTPAERIHLTLKFLGEQADEVPARLVEALGPVVGRHRDVVLEARGVGAFPTMRRPRVVWVGVRPEPRLELLHHAVEAACGGLGFEVEGRPFRPHLTLGRARPGAEADLGKRLATAAKAVVVRATVPVEGVDVMRSELGTGGSRYTLLHRIPLAG